VKKPVVFGALAILLLAIIVLGLAYESFNLASPTTTVTLTPKEITITDTLGRNVTIHYPVEKVVVCDDLVAELVQLIGAADNVVGIEPSIKDRGYFPKMTDKPIVGSQFRDLNYELIVELEPDVVLLMDVGPVAKVIEKLSKIGVKAIVISIRPEKIPETIELLGKMFGKEERAKEIIEWWNNKWSLLEERISSANSKVKLKAFVGMGFSPTDKLPTQTWGKLANWNYIFERLSLVNIASEKLKTHGEVDLEFVIEANPDIIIIGDWSDVWLGYTKNSTELAEKMIEVVLKDPVLKDVSAVRRGKVYAMHYSMLLSFRSVIGAYYLAKVVYPELFEDVNPDEIHEEYFEKWLEVPYKGIWFYPEPWGE